MIRYAYEYRINKKGAECFRSSNYDAILRKLEALMSNKPNVTFTVQSRSCRLDKLGIMEKDFRGRPAWGPWS